MMVEQSELGENYYGLCQKHHLELTAPCKREFEKLTKKDKTLRKITEKILDELQLDPYTGEKLYANFPGWRSIHYLGNKYRIIYQLVEESATKIIVQCIGHRKNVYSKLAKWYDQGK